jgi:hypothetical protein
VRLDGDVTLELELGREGALDLEQVSAWVDGVAVCGQRAAVERDARQLQVLAVEEQRCIGGRAGRALDVQCRENLLAPRVNWRCCDVVIEAHEWRQTRGVMHTSHILSGKNALMATCFTPPNLRGLIEDLDDELNLVHPIVGPLVVLSELLHGRLCH